MEFLAEHQTSVLLSLKVAMLSVLAALPFATLAGFVLARRSFSGKVLLEGILMLPMVMPPVTTGYLLLSMFGNQSFIGSWLYELTGLKMTFNFFAATLAATVVAFPLMVRSIKTSMEMVDPALEEASLSLGLSPLMTFFRVTFPLARPGLLSGVVLGFARSLGEFGATITFAGNIAGKTRTLPLAIYSAMQVPGEERTAFLLVLISVLISFAAITGAYYFQKRDWRGKF